MKPRFAAILINGDRYILKEDYIREGTSSDNLLAEANHFFEKISGTDNFYQGMSENGNTVTFRGSSVIAIEIIVDYRP